MSRYDPLIINIFPPLEILLVNSTVVAAMMTTTAKMRAVNSIISRLREIENKKRWLGKFNYALH